tara:strand:- start:10768 stop:12195 length:1428 start_codon:yes stop_codon:yes gene_type:complete
MYSTKKTIILLLSTVATSGLGVSAGAATWRVTPTLTATETYTDNVNLDETVRQGDFVTQISPQVQLTGTGARLNASILYGANYFFYPGSTGGEKHDLRHTVQANLNSELVNDLFFIDAGANVDQQFLDRRQAISSVDVSQTKNRRTVQSYRFSPYLAHRFGSWATTQLRYELRHVRSSSDTEQTTLNTFFGNSLTHRGTFSLSNGPAFQRLGWTLSAVYANEEREDQADFDTRTLNADLSYQLLDQFALLGSIGYQDRDGGNSFANFDGVTWDAGFRFVPGPRTSISMRYGNRSGTDTFSLNAQYKMTAKHSINLTYTDTIQTFQSFAFDEIPGPVIDPTQSGNFVSGDITRRKQARLYLTGSRGRTSYSMSGSYSRNKSDNSALDEDRYSAAVSLNRQLSRRLSLGSSFSYNLSKFASDGTEDTFWSASVNGNYSISQSLVGTLGYTHSDRDQARFANLNGGTNYISLSIRATF